MSSTYINVINTMINEVFLKLAMNLLLILRGAPILFLNWTVKIKEYKELDLKSMFQIDQQSDVSPHLCLK